MTGPGRHAPALALPTFAVALLLVLLSVLGILFWPPWSEHARKRRLGVMTALAGDNGPALARGHTPVQNGNQA